MMGDPNPTSPPKRLSFGEETATSLFSMSQPEDTRDARSDPTPSETTQASTASLQVGDWEADPALNLLRRGGLTTHLEPKAMELLCFLAERPGAVVSREALLAALWPGLVVGDDALTQAVIKLRKALGDDAREPTYIQTVPKRGYRLIAQVGTLAPEQARVPIAQGSATRRARALSYAALGLAVALMVATALYLHRPTAPPDSAPVVGVDHEADAVLAAGSPPTIAVLPFEVLGEDPQQHYLARGLTAELASDLSRLSGLTAIGADRLPGMAEDATEPSAHATFQVWGGVQRTEDHISVEVRLVETATGRQLWSARYDRPFGDLFAIQDAIGMRLAETLSVEITAAERQRRAHRFSRSVDAYDLFLRARSALLVRQPQENAQARWLFRRAIGLDPAFARAYGGLALTDAADYRNQWAKDGETSLDRAQQMAQTAVQIDPNLPEAYWVLGYVGAQRRHHDEALVHLDRALALAPSFADALALKGGIKTYVGEPAASIPLLRRAMRLNPAAGYLYFLLLGRAYVFLGDDEQALINLREAMSRNPANLEAHVYLAIALERNGDHEGARWEAEEICTIQPDFSAETWLETYPMTDPRQLGQLKASLDRLDL